MIVGKISKDKSKYISQVNDFMNWCKQQYLRLSVKEKSEKKNYFQTRHRVIPDKIKVGNEMIDRVNEYKYLGVVIAEALRGTANNDVYKKWRQRLHLAC